MLGSMAVSLDREQSLASTPPMGWNSWNKFGCNVSEDLIRQIADAMVATGMKDAGYQYVNIDDCWQGERDSQGFIQPDAKKFPSGMKALADYVHAKGLKFGHLLRCGRKDLCVAMPAAAVASIRMPASTRAVGRRLSEVRLVQHLDAGCALFL